MCTECLQIHIPTSNQVNLLCAKEICLMLLHILRQSYDCYDIFEMLFALMTPSFILFSVCCYCSLTITSGVLKVKGPRQLNTLNRPDQLGLTPSLCDRLGSMGQCWRKACLHNFSLVCSRQSVIALSDSAGTFNFFSCSSPALSSTSMHKGTERRCYFKRNCFSLGKEYSGRGNRQFFPNFVSAFL